MSMSSESRAEWLAGGFWEQLDLLEKRHQSLRAEHDSARRGLEAAGSTDDTDLLQAWQRYCAVIAELDQSTTEFEHLRAHSS